MEIWSFLVIGERFEPGTFVLPNMAISVMYVWINRCTVGSPAKYMDGTLA